MTIAAIQPASTMKGFMGPVPVRAVYLRLMGCVPGEEAPAWASFLPSEVSHSLHLSTADDKGSDGTASTSSPAAAPTRFLSDPSLTGRVWSLVQRQHGSRAVQAAIDACTTNQQREALASELKGHVWDAIRCPNANFVVQRLIVKMRPQASQMFIDEILERGSKGCLQVARHKYACRIMQRLLEHCRNEQVAPIIDAILKDTNSLSRHPYGNYVMQQLFEYGTPEQRSKACKLLEIQAAPLASDCYGSAVVAKALTHCSEQDRLRVANILANEPGLVTTMARTRHGHTVSELVLQESQGLSRERAWQEICSQALLLRANRYGRVLLANVFGDSMRAIAEAGC